MSSEISPEKRVKITFYVNPELLEIAEWMVSVRGGNLGDTHRKAWEKGLVDDIEGTLAIEKLRAHIESIDTDKSESK